MARLKMQQRTSHFFGIGVMHNVHAENIGTLWRSAYIMGAAFIFTVDKKYKQQSGDVFSAWSRIPLYHYRDLADLKAHLPHAARLIGVEMDERAVPLHDYRHPSTGVYLLGSEKHGLTKAAIEACHELVCLPGNFSLNVSVAGSIVMYDRIGKLETTLP